MKRFAFRLESVLGVRRERLAAVEREFAASRELVLGKESEALGLNREREGVHEHLRAMKLDESTRRAVNSLRAYLQRLWIAQENVAVELAALQEKLMEKRAELVEARRQVKALERLRERRLSEWKAEFSREEQKALDDLPRVPEEPQPLRIDGERKANAS